MKNVATWKCMFTSSFLIKKVSTEWNKGIIFQKESTIAAVKFLKSLLHLRKLFCPFFERYFINLVIKLIWVKKCYIVSTEHDVNIRLGKAWDTLDELEKIWKSNLTDNRKRHFFRAAVETVLLYGSVSWTLTTHLEKKIDGAYTGMLCTAINRSWKDHLTNVELYGHIPPISKSLQQQRMRFVGHCWRSREELAGDILLWKPTHGHQPRGRPKKTYIDQLIDDTGCRMEELPIAMEDRERWKERVMEYRASSTWWWWWWWWWWSQ